MGLLDFFRGNKDHQKTLKNRAIQSTTEGERNGVYLESLFTGQRINSQVPGITNSYSEYTSQVRGTYRKYNGRDNFGNSQTRSIIDLRTAFIAGEGLNVTTQDERLAEWLEAFITKNKLSGRFLIDSVKGSEMSGQSLLLLKTKTTSKQDTDIQVKIGRRAYHLDSMYRPVYYDPNYSDDVVAMEVCVNGQWELLTDRNFIYIRTGGDDYNSEGPTTRVGLVLTDIENYDRALRDVRYNNHITARVTPNWKTDSSEEAKKINKQLADTRWEFGKATAGTAEFNYKAPPTGAHENLKTEAVLSIKTIASTTGVPVHWLGFVDLMSNRSTAETLYDSLKNATINERLAWEEGVYNLLLKAQELYINAGGTDITYNPDFSVRLPLLDFNSFLERIRAYSLAYSDRAISLEDYRNAIPAIDPIKTKKAVEEEDQAAMNSITEGVDPVLSDEDMEDKEEQGAN